MKPEVFRKRFFEGAPRYRWLETIGRGGVGIVYKALDMELDDVVAIKVLSLEPDRDEQAMLARFKRELSLNRKIKHPNVARMFDFGFSGDYPYITMEFIPGKDLWTIIDQRGRLAPTEAVAILRQVARGSEAVHKLGIVHRDLKSQNVIVDPKGAVAILDFGLARGKVNEGFTLASTLLGTPHYMSPEQALGKPVDARSDIYSIGVIGFEALTGRLPFVADSPVAVAMKHVTDPIPESLLDDTEISPRLKAIIMRSLSKDPDERYPSAADLETALALLDHPISGAEERRLEKPVGPRESETLLEALESALDSIIVPLKAPRIPTARPKSVPASAAPPGPPPSVSHRDPVVLIVNDEVRELLRWATALSSVACRTIEVRSGQEAMETLLVRPVDIVVLDVTLPDMDGFDVTRIIKSQPNLAMLPVLLTTGRRDRNQLAFGIQSGAADVLTKPLGPGILASSVWKILEYRGFTPPADPSETKTAKRRTRAKRTPV